MLATLAVAMLVAALFAALLATSAPAEARPAVGGPSPAAPSQGAPSQGATATYRGFVVGDETLGRATRVRAVSQAGVVCGTADVGEDSRLAGRYHIVVASGAQKQGCPREGETFTFRLLYGSLDEGIDATARPVYAPGEHVVHLFAEPGSGDPEGFVGDPPPPGGVAFLRWEGGNATPIEAAVSTLDFEARALLHFERPGERWVVWVNGAPDFVQTYTHVNRGDLVLVRAAEE